MRKMMLGLAALLLVVSAKVLAAQVTNFEKNYDTHIDQGGILHCLNDGNKCVSWG